MCTVCNAFDDMITLAQKLNLTTLVACIVKTDLTNVLKQGGTTYTLFAPNNTAFDNLPKDEVDKLNTNATYLETVLKYHIIEQDLPTFLIDNNKEYLTLWNGSSLRLNVYNKENVYTVNGAVFVKSNNVAKNGIIHVIERVLYKPIVQNAVDLISTNSNLSSLLLAITKAQLQSALQGGQLTIFAPTNAAFSKLPATDYQKIINNVTLLKDVLEYHVVSGIEYSAGLKNGTVKALDDKTLNITVWRDGGVTINTANVSTADVSVTNGVIHIIDSVLIPPNTTLSQKRINKTEKLFKTKILD